MGCYQASHEQTGQWGRRTRNDKGLTHCFLSDGTSGIHLHLVLKQGGDDGVEGRAEVHKQDLGEGCLESRYWRVKWRAMLTASSTDLLAL